MEAVLGKIQTLVKGQLGGLKSKVKAEGQRKVQKVKEKVPTKDQIMEQMIFFIFIGGEWNGTNEK